MYTFSLLFMCFSEIYLKWHLSILDLFIVLCKGALVHISCTEFPKNTSEEETKTTDASSIKTV